MYVLWDMISLLSTSSSSLAKYFTLTNALGSELLVETENRTGLYVWVYKRQAKHKHGCLEAEVSWSI